MGSVEDAILHVLNNIYVHLDKPDMSICLMFYDYSLAFITQYSHTFSLRKWQTKTLVLSLFSGSLKAGVRRQQLKTGRFF